MYDDDLCFFFCPSLSGLKELLTVFSRYTAAHDIVFSVKYCNEFKPELSVAGRVIKFVNSIKYLGVFQISTLIDDCDILRQVKYLYAVGNLLRSKFLKCSAHIKKYILFCAHGCALYASQLWCCYSYESYRRLRVSYNDF